MKKIFTLLTCLISLIIFSQELQYEGVVKVDSTATKEELFNRARSWFAKTYKSEKDVMSIEDKSLGEITGNGAFIYVPEIFYFGSSCAKGYIMYKVNLYVKDGRYKYKIHSFIHEGTKCIGGGITSYGLITEDKKPERFPKSGWNEIKELIKSKVPKTIESLKESMNKPYEGSKDW